MARKARYKKFATKLWRILYINSYCECWWNLEMSFLLVSSWIVTCSRPTQAKLFKNFYLLVKQGSIYDYRKLPMHPFPNPTFCPKCKRRVRGGLGDEFLKTLYWSSLYMSIFREFKLHAYGKRQTSQNRKWEDKTSSKQLLLIKNYHKFMWRNNEQ